MNETHRKGDIGTRETGPENGGRLPKERGRAPLRGFHVENQAEIVAKPLKFVQRRVEDLDAARGV